MRLSTASVALLAALLTSACAGKNGKEEEVPKTEVCTFSGSHEETCSGCSVDDCTLTCATCRQADGTENAGPSLEGPCDEEVNNCDGELVCGSCGLDRSCWDCACETFEIDGGCLEVCDGAFEGSGTPNFCNGTTAASQCEICVTMSCGMSPESCMQ